MIVFIQIEELRKALAQTRKSGKSIGLVPTMGALHEGHLKLIKTSKEENDFTVCSIFINPIQFNNASDFEKYPKTLEQDTQLLQSLKCDAVFAPSPNEMYPYGRPALTIDFGYQNNILEGQFRPGHFSGVGIVVAKLFNIIQPDKAYFGQKDFQQCMVIRQMVNELSISVKLRIIETMREADGLAMSSRNKRLNNEERLVAPAIYESLLYAQTNLLTKPFEIIRLKIKEGYLETGLRLEYIDLVDFNSGALVSEAKAGQKYAICVAAFLGDVRLIDNVVVNT